MAERADNSARWILRRALKAATAGALVGAGVHRVVRAWRRHEAGGTRVLVLSYHRVTHDFAASARDELPSLFVSAQTLQRQIAQIARTRDVVSLADARRILAEPDAPRRRRDVVTVTFDDGYADNHHVALPVLSALRVPAAFFVATGFIGTSRRFPHDRLWASLRELSRRGIPADQAGLPDAVQQLITACAEPGPAATLDRLIARLPGPRLVAVADALEARLGLSEGDLPPDARPMSWEEVRELEASGMDVGGHGVNHAVLSNLPLGEARLEITGCRDAIAAHLGHAPRHFAYPNGYYTAGIRRALADAGFETGLTTEDRENVRGADPFAIARKVLWENSTLGPVSYSAALATCNMEGVFHALRVAHPVSGERPDAVPGAGAGAAARERAAS
jgi:peptidoglycan/xylan/chitin deacetylase (PgdA/CDA1 family)